MENENIELGEFLVQEGQPTDFDPVKFIINDDVEAIWAMRNLAQAQKRIDEIKEQALNEVARIGRWAELVVASPNNTVTYFENALKSYMVRLRDEGRKSLVLPDGEVTSRATSSKASVSDLEAFLEWAKANDRKDLMRVKIEANLAALKDVTEYVADSVIDTATGEAIPGLTHIEGGVSVSIKIAGE